ncbi:MAG: hypothetical protein JWN30_1657 [Bacilli bacterium]|nr:hypothetical protein [Bacilli bacterium]
MIHWLTQPITELGRQIDAMFYWILAITGIVFILVEGLLVYYIIRYRRTHAEQQGLDYHGNTKLEVLWTLVPALILVVIGYFCVPLVQAAQTPPSNAIVIQVIGHEWSWEFKYPNGVDTQGSEPLRIPAGQNVLFKITSGDVIHDFWVPQFRVKQDAVPGRETRVWVNVTDTDIGTYPLRCAEYCGVLHSQMVSTVQVLSPADYQSWLDGQAKAAASKAQADQLKAQQAKQTGSAPLGDATNGQKLATQFGCLSCHAIDNTQKAGPSWKGLAGTQVPLSDGKTVTADPAYLKESIQSPTAKVVKGYSPIMPQTQMSDSDVNDLVAYIQSLK